MLQPFEFVSACLADADAFVRSLPEGSYAFHAEPMQGSIGGHLRHSLEHVENLLAGLEHGEVFFEKRHRDARLGSDAAFARERIRALAAALACAEAAGQLQGPMASRSSLSGELEDCVVIESTVQRELVYIGLHFVHHMALMAISARLQGISVPADFGKAPATRVFEKSPVGA